MNPLRAGRVNSNPHVPSRKFYRLGTAGLAGVLLAATLGCTATRPPADVQAAIRVIGRQLPSYVAEANRSLGEAGHPDAERLQGIGERLVRAVAALEKWAGGTGAPGAPSGNAPGDSASRIPSGSAPDQPAIRPAPSGCAPGNPSPTLSIGNAPTDSPGGTP